MPQDITWYVSQDFRDHLLAEQGLTLSACTEYAASQTDPCCESRMMQGVPGMW